jgi:hypothetical protein
LIGAGNKCTDSSQCASGLCLTETVFPVCAVPDENNQNTNGNCCSDLDCYGADLQFCSSLRKCEYRLGLKQQTSSSSELTLYQQLYTREGTLGWAAFAANAIAALQDITLNGASSSSSTGVSAGIIILIIVMALIVCFFLVVFIYFASRTLRTNKKNKKR